MDTDLKTGASGKGAKIVFAVLFVLSIPLALFYPILAGFFDFTLGELTDKILTVLLFLPFFVFLLLLLRAFSLPGSAKENLTLLTVCAMLVALYVVLNRFVSITTPGFKIGFSVVCPMIAGMLFGPGAGAVVYGMGDLLSAILFPFGTYHPGFTVTAVLMGFLWGLCTHPRPIGSFINRAFAQPSGKRRFWGVLWILLPALFNCLVLGLFVNTIWVAQLYSKHTYWGWFVQRLLEYLVMIPVNVLLAAAIAPAAAALRKTFSKTPAQEPAKKGALPPSKDGNG